MSGDSLLLFSESEKVSKFHGLGQMLIINSYCLGQKPKAIYDFKTWTKNVMTTNLRDEVSFKHHIHSAEKEHTVSITNLSPLIIGCSKLHCMF
jgi:hypothetical protein